MRILHYLSEVTLEHGGVVRSVLDFSKALAAAGHDVTLACFDDTSVPGEWKCGHDSAWRSGTPRALTLDWPGLPKPIRRFRWREAQVMARQIAACDVLHLHGPWESTNAQLAAMARRLGKAYILSIHGMMDDWCMAQGALKKRLYTWWRVRPMARGAAAVLFTAEGEKRQVMRWLGGVREDRARVLPLMFDASEFIDLPGPEAARAAFPALRTNGPIVLFLSRLHPKKGVETLIDACAILKREFAARERQGAPAFRLVIAGSGTFEYEAALKKRAAEAGLSDRAFFLGMVTGREKVSLMQAADVCALPTSQENWGFVILESLAAGTPVVTTRGVDIWPEVEKGGGAVISEGTAASIAAAVRGLLEDPARTERIGAAGRAWVLSWLEAGRVLARYEGLYRGAVDASLGSSR